MNLVYQLLKRWWYALPKWPPENYDPTPKLNEHKLRVVQLSEYKKEPNIDENNFIKCFEMPGFKYEYVDYNGKTYDLRPQENKPSFNALMKLSEAKLSELIVTSITKQIEEAKSISTSESQGLLKALQNELKSAESQFRKYNTSK
jgi:hypothetical protein